MTTSKMTATAGAGRSGMLRSPSHESDLSLSSSLASAPNHHHRVTFATKSTLGTHSPSLNGDRGVSPVPRQRPVNIPEIFFFEEDGNTLLKSCGKLSDAMGIPKSFSTSDIATAVMDHPNDCLRPYVSELAVCSFQRCGFLLDYPNRLEQTSRSCSTWVAVGELASTSQLPSPHGTHSINSLQFSNHALSAAGGHVPCGGSSTGGQSSSMGFSTVDLIRSVNKKVRKNYIRKKILMTYRALERMSESEFNLDRLVAVANEQLEKKRASPGPTELVVPNLNAPVVEVVKPEAKLEDKPQEEELKKVELIEEKEELTKPSTSSALKEQPNEEDGGGAEGGIKTVEQRSKKFAVGINKNITMCDIELERGRSLSKYERNMMIFNWLHSLVLPLPLDEDPPI